MWMLCKRLTACRVNGHGTPVGFFITQIRVRLFAASFSTDQCSDNGKQSFAASYLMSSCGLPAKDAISLSRRLHFESAEKPDSVIALLRNHGFTDTHIFKLVKSCPELLSCSNPSKTLLPKLNFFYSLGISGTELASFLCSSAKVLKMSLEKRILPFHDFLKDVIRLDDLKIAESIKKASWTDNKDGVRSLATNIALLRELDVPETRLAHLITVHIGILLRKPIQFKEKVDEVVQMGFDSKKSSFCDALIMVSKLSIPTRELKGQTYVKCGWSGEDLETALKKHPLCMRLSEESICSKMGYLVNKMGVKPADIASVPTVLLYSLDRRVIPRCSIVKVLMIRGLLNKQVPISSILCTSKKMFRERFISKFEKDIPQLVNIFQGEMGLSEISSFVREEEAKICCS
ncbi:uncharacterized protein LOC124940393 [Impatiens glandulifera]|uniref:uncharacterized protein LOC124940393 n=1 Tax=Impatiens glandulifera TaxID=253017 RepID=UPI001FB0EB9B|nr:uncharacterized protein LOC124940393 [Impatiens glandulifera]